jgi:hypothetical protein
MSGKQHGVKFGLLTESADELEVGDIWLPKCEEVRPDSLEKLCLQVAADGENQERKVNRVRTMVIPEC